MTYWLLAAIISAPQIGLITPQGATIQIGYPVCAS
jgi:hypothetical protein